MEEPLARSYFLRFRYGWLGPNLALLRSGAPVTQPSAFWAFAFDSRPSHPTLLRRRLRNR
jgi:hypothetical protein